MTVREFYQGVLGICEEGLLEKLEKNSRKRMVKRGEIIQEAGDACPNISFLVSGLFRGFFLDGNGNDVTDCFAYQPGMPLVASLRLNGPSVVSIEALEDSEIIYLDADVIYELVSTRIELAVLYARLLSNALQMHWESKVAVANHSATARYLWFQKQFPGLIHRVSHKYVASFLGMTPVSLSRARRSMGETQGQKVGAGR